MPWPHSSPLNILHMTEEHEIRTIHVSLAAGDPIGDKGSDLSGLCKANGLNEDCCEKSSVFFFLFVAVTLLSNFLIFPDDSPWRMCRVK